MPIAALKQVTQRWVCGRECGQGKRFKSVGGGFFGAKYNQSQGEIGSFEGNGYAESERVIAGQ